MGRVGAGTFIGVADERLPDFEGLYGSGPMTARMAARLWFVADSIEGMYFDGMAEQMVSFVYPMWSQVVDNDEFDKMIEASPSASRKASAQ